MDVALSPREQQLYRVVSGATAPVWLAMVAAPHSPVTARVVRAAGPVQLGLAGAYVGLLATSVARRGGERVRFSDGDSVRRGLLAPRGFLAAWSHLVTLDLVAGVGIWRAGVTDGRDTRAALVATWLAGPSGLLVDAALRGRPGAVLRRRAAAAPRARRSR